jgi:thiamine biosynthesis lipoprotein
MFSDGRYRMGTVFEVTLDGVAREAAVALSEALFASADRLDQQLSVYIEESGISRINRSAGGDAVAVGPAVTQILHDAVRYAELTGGAFDVTIGPLVALWMDAAQRGRAPSADELATARRRVGSAHIELDSGRVRLARPEMRIDLGGVAKGYALDQMLPLLRTHRVERALLNFGQSSTWALGAPTGTDGWRLLVRGPEGGFLGVITLRDRALSVSGSLGQFAEIEGKRYGHIIDPRTGQPLLRTRQALVVAPNAALAEALTKAMLILDRDAALALVAGQPDCHGLLIEAGGKLDATPGWDAAVAFERLEGEALPD